MHLHVVFVATLFSLACQIPESQDPVIGTEDLEKRVEKSRSIHEVDNVLSQLLAEREAQTKIEALLTGWGKYGDWYDLTVVKFLWERWPSWYSEGDVDSERLIPIIQSRIRSKPELNRQVYWYVQWKYDPLEFPELCRRITPAYSAFHDKSVPGQEFPKILYIASLTNEPEKILSANWDKLYLHWHLCALEFLSLRSFLKYDINQGYYVIDSDAFKKHRYLDTSQQTPTQRSTPLPNWSSAPIPKSQDRQSY
jgi:hypothetical protein